MELIGGVVFAVIFAGVLGYAFLGRKSQDSIEATREEILRHYGVDVDPVDFHSDIDPGDDNRFI